MIIIVVVLVVVDAFFDSRKKEKMYHCLFNCYKYTNTHTMTATDGPSHPEKKCTMRCDIGKTDGRFCFFHSLVQVMSPEAADWTGDNAPPPPLLLVLLISDWSSSPSDTGLRDRNDRSQDGT
jgi:hypothetical protein